MFHVNCISKVDTVITVRLALSTQLFFLPLPLALQSFMDLGLLDDPPPDIPIK
jgi:hypothetical protein